MSLYRNKKRLTKGVSRFLSIMLLLGLGACNFIPSPTAAPATPAGDLIGTAAAQTIAVNQQQATIAALEAQLTAQAMTLQAPTLVPSATTEPTQIPTAVPPSEAPTWTPLPTYTLLPTFTFIPTISQPQVPMLSASVDTRCRLGPSTTWDVLSFILVGQQAEILGINPEGTWWLIRDPANRYRSCWVWGQTTYPINNASMVPIVQPPPPPTTVPSASFNLAYVNFHVCGGVAMATFKVNNTGTMSFASSQITIRDLTHDVGVAGPESSNTPFYGSSNACGIGFSPLDEGDSAYILKGVGAMPLSGIKGRGIVVLCTKPNLAGQCIEQKTNFTFP